MHHKQAVADVVTKLALTKKMRRHASCGVPGKRSKPNFTRVFYVGQQLPTKHVGGFVFLQIAPWASEQIQYGL